MTATPYTSDPMDFINLMNIIREENDQLPNTFEEFSEEYLMDNGVFKETPKENFMDKIAGQISYLNREKDARQFAYPVFNSIKVDISTSDVQKYDEDINSTNKELNEENAKVENGKKTLKDTKSRLKEEEKRKLEECKSVPVKERKECKERIKREMKGIKDNGREIKEAESNVKQLKNKLKKLEKDKKKAVENDISQETALKKCIPRKDLQKK
jgi:DNA repair exonuclease SbcCD ATPase subunit